MKRVHIALLTAGIAAWPFACFAEKAPALQWDAVVKEVTAESAYPMSMNVAFRLTNGASHAIVVTAVKPSCGCTTANIPPLPWKLAPGESGKLEFEIDLEEKHGVVNKSVEVETSEGNQTLEIRATIPEPLGPRRQQNIELAGRNRQAVFLNDCATCHAEPARGKTGAALYQVACGICHDAEHRASMVPDLRVVAAQGIQAPLWEHWIRHGKDGTLMPAFAQAAGGPLDDAQIRSLVAYLTEHFSKPNAARE